MDQKRADIFYSYFEMRSAVCSLCLLPSVSEASTMNKKTDSALVEITQMSCSWLNSAQSHILGGWKKKLEKVGTEAQIEFKVYIQTCAIVEVEKPGVAPKPQTHFYAQ